MRAGRPEQAVTPGTSLVRRPTSPVRDRTSRRRRVRDGRMTSYDDRATAVHSGTPWEPGRMGPRAAGSMPAQLHTGPRPHAGESPAARTPPLRGAEGASPPRNLSGPWTARARRLWKAVPRRSGGAHPRCKPPPAPPSGVPAAREALRSTTEGEATRLPAHTACPSCPRPPREPPWTARPFVPPPVTCPPFVSVSSPVTSPSRVTAGFRRTRGQDGHSWRKRPRRTSRKNSAKPTPDTAIPRGVQR